MGKSGISNMKLLGRAYRGC